MPAAKPQIEIHNQRILDLMKEAIRDGKVNYEMDFCKEIGFDHTNLPKVKSGAQGFKISHLVNAAKFTGVSMDWICGLSNTKRPKTKDYSAIDLIKEGLRQLETKSNQ